MSPGEKLPPTLEQLRSRLSEAYSAEESRSSAAPRVRRRRVLLVAAIVLGLLVPAAIGTRSIWAPTGNERDPGGPRPTTRPVVIASGEAAGERWQLSAFESDRGVCLQFVVEGTAGRTVDCQPLDANSRTLDVRLAIGTGSSFLFGVVPLTVEEVNLSPAGGHEVHVRPDAPDAAAVRRAGLRSDFRFYVAPIGTGASLEGLRAEARDASGRAVLVYPAPRG